MALTVKDMELIAGMVRSVVAETVAAAAPAAPAELPAALRHTERCPIVAHFTEGVHVGRNADGMFTPGGMIFHLENALKRASQSKTDRAAENAARIADLTKRLGL